MATRLLRFAKINVTICVDKRAKNNDLRMDRARECCRIPNFVTLPTSYSFIRLHLNENVVRLIWQERKNSCACVFYSY